MLAHRSTARLAARAGAAAVAVVLVAGCSNSSTVAAKRPNVGTGTASAAAGGVQEITITTGNDYRFHPSTLVVHPGKVRIVLENTEKQGSGPPHNLSIMGLPTPVAIPLTAAADTNQVEFTAPSPGTYSFVCTIHVAQGQTGKLIVKS